MNAIRRGLTFSLKADIEAGRFALLPMTKREKHNLFSGRSPARYRSRRSRDAAFRPAGARERLAR